VWRAHHAIASFIRLRRFTSIWLMRSAHLISHAPSLYCVTDIGELSFWRQIYAERNYVSQELNWRFVYYYTLAAIYIHIFDRYRKAVSILTPCSRRTNTWRRRTKGGVHEPRMTSPYDRCARLVETFVGSQYELYRHVCHETTLIL
jgi:hypothetical protein